VKLTTVADLDAQVQRLWDQGDILRSVVTNEAIFPLRLRLKAPNASDVAERFDVVRVWSAQLRLAKCYRVEMQSVRNRVHGTNSVPSQVWIDTMSDAVTVIDKCDDLARFGALVNATSQRRGTLLPWLAGNPLRALVLANVWARLLDVVDWLEAHPRPGVYIRQMDVPGVHSKFIETHRGVLTELLDLALPAGVIEPSAVGVSRFATRYGFRDKPLRVRFRMLDPARSLFPTIVERDVTLDAGSFARLDPPVSNVFITENEVNFLAFPDVPDSLVIFGAGYGFDLLADVCWLSRCRVIYWGDIDTHGFAILDQLRASLPHAESFLMDRETLLAFPAQWGIEDQPVRRELSRLSAQEQSLFGDLCNNAIANNLRLEQEHIGFRYLQAALAKLV
jgi:hypothetical protein